MRKKARGIGLKTKVKGPFPTQETWTDGQVHDVQAYYGVDRKYWIRFKPNFGFRFRHFQWSRAHGRRTR